MSELAVLQLEIRDNADKAASGLEALATSLGNIKNALSGGLKLTTTVNQLKKFNDTVNTIGTGQTVGKLNALATIMNRIADAVERLDKSSVTLKRTMQAINSFNRPMGLPSGASRPAPTVETASIQEAKNELTQAQEVAGNIHLNQGEITQEAENVSERIRNLTERLSMMREALARIRENGGTNTALTATANAITHLVGELSSLGVSTRAMNQATQEADAARNAVDGLASSSEKAAAGTTAVRDACSETTDKLKEMQFQLAVDEMLLKKFESEGADSGKIAAQKTIIAAQKAAIARMGSGAAEMKGTSEAAADLGTKMETVATSAEKAAEAVNAKPSGNTWMDKVLDLVNTSSEIDRVRNKIEALQNTLAQDLKAGGMSQVDIDKRVAEIQKYMAKEQKLIAERGPLYKPETGMSAEDKAAVASAAEATATSTPVSVPNVAKLSEEYIQGKHHIDAMRESLENLKAKLSEGLTTGSLSTSEADKLGASIRKLEEDYKKATSASQRFITAVGNIKGSLKGLKDALFDANGGLLGFLKGMARMARYRMFRAIIREITEGITTGLQNYRKYSQAIGGSYYNDMKGLDNTLLKMKNSIGAALAPALQSLIPIIQRVVSWFITLVNYVNQFFALMRGQKTWSMAVEVDAESVEDTTNKLNGAASAAKNLLASWDELNIIQSQSGGGGGGGNAQDLSQYEEMFTEVEEFDGRIKEFVTWLQENADKVEKALAGIALHLLGFKTSTILITLGIAGSFIDAKGNAVDGATFLQTLADNIDDILVGAAGGALIGFSLTRSASGAVIGFTVGAALTLVATSIGWMIGASELEGVDFLSKFLQEYLANTLTMALSGALIGGVVGGWRGAFIGFTIGAAVGLAVSALSWSIEKSGSGIVDTELAAMLVNDVLTLLGATAAGAVFGFTKGGLEGAIIGGVIGASISLFASSIAWGIGESQSPNSVVDSQLQNNAIGNIGDILATAFGAGAIAFAASGGDAKLTMLSASLAVGVSMWLKKLSWASRDEITGETDVDKAALEESIANSIVSSIGLMAGGTIVGAKIGQVKGAIIGFTVGAVASIVLAAINYSGTQSAIGKQVYLAKLYSDFHIDMDEALSGVKEYYFTANVTASLDVIGAELENIQKARSAINQEMVRLENAYTVWVQADLNTPPTDVLSQAQSLCSTVSDMLTSEDTAIRVSMKLFELTPEQQSVDDTVLKAIGIQQDIVTDIGKKIGEWMGQGTAEGYKEELPKVLALLNSVIADMENTRRKSEVASTAAVLHGRFVSGKMDQDSIDNYTKAYMEYRNQTEGELIALEQSKYIELQTAYELLDRVVNGGDRSQETLEALEIIGYDTSKLNKETFTEVENALKVYGENGEQLYAMVAAQIDQLFSSSDLMFKNDLAEAYSTIAARIPEDMYYFGSRLKFLGADWKSLGTRAFNTLYYATFGVHSPSEMQSTPLKNFLESKGIRPTNQGIDPMKRYGAGEYRLADVSWYKYIMGQETGLGFDINNEQNRRLAADKLLATMLKGFGVIKTDVDTYLEGGGNPYATLKSNEHVDELVRAVIGDSLGMTWEQVDEILAQLYEETTSSYDKMPNAGKGVITEAEAVNADTTTVETPVAEVEIVNANLEIPDVSQITNPWEAFVTGDPKELFANGQNETIKAWIESGFDTEWMNSQQQIDFADEVTELYKQSEYQALADLFTEIYDAEPIGKLGSQEDYDKAIETALLYIQQNGYLPNIGMPGVNNNGGAGGSGGGGGGNGDGAGQKLDTTNNHLDAMERSLKNLEKGFQIRPSLALYNAVRESERMFSGLHG